MVGPIKIIGMLAVFISLTLALVHTCFGMTGLITDQALSWIGGHMNSTLGARHDQEAGNVFLAGMANVKNAGVPSGNRIIKRGDEKAGAATAVAGAATAHGEARD